MLKLSFIPKVSEDSDATVPHSEDNIDNEDFVTILKGIGMTKVEAKKIKDEHVHWYTLISDKENEMMQNLPTTCNR